MSDSLAVLIGPANTRLGGEICKTLCLSPTAYECRRHPDGEIQVDLKQSVRGCDVFLVQSTSPPVEEHLMELLLLADSCRRSGASRVTAVIPYFGYARQDRRIERRAFGARVAASIIATGNFARLMVVDAHTPALEGFLDIPMDHLTAVPLLAHAAATSVHDNSIVVAPDLGAIRLARAYAQLFRVPMAYIHKTRLNGDEVTTHSVVGDVRGRRPVIVDDMLSTGGTIEAAIAALHDAGAMEPVTVVVTHGLFVGRARDTLRRLPIERLIVTDTVTPAGPVDPQVEIASVATLVATAILRNHRNESLADLRASA